MTVCRSAIRSRHVYPRLQDDMKLSLESRRKAGFESAAGDLQLVKQSDSTTSGSYLRTNLDFLSDSSTMAAHPLHQG